MTIGVKTKMLDNLCITLLVVLSADLALAANATTPVTPVTSEEGRLVNDLLRNYNKLVKPTLKSTDKINVYASFNPTFLNGINEKDMTLSMTASLTMFWMDELLRWDPAQYGGIYIIVLPSSEVWKPEVWLFNSVSNMRDLGFDSPSRIQLYSSGAVIYTPQYNYITLCNLDLTYFPFDEHNCEIWFGTSVYLMSQQEFHVNSPAINNYIETESAWKLVNASLVKNITTFEGEGYQVNISSLYQMWNIVVPSLLMTVMSLFVFILPTESGEKVGLAITVLLSYSVTLLMMSETTPSTGTTMPMLTEYLVLSMALTALCLLFTVIVINIHHHSPQTPVPAVVCQIFLRGVATVLLMRRKDLEGTVSGATVTPSQAALRVEDLTDEHQKKQPPSAATSALIPPHLLHYLEEKIASEHESEVVSARRDQWEHLARVVDRLFLVTAIVGIVILGAVYMSQLFTTA